MKNVDYKVIKKALIMWLYNKMHSGGTAVLYPCLRPVQGKRSTQRSILLTCHCTVFHRTPMLRMLHCRLCRAVICRKGLRTNCASADK
jgi:hypothetical protein